MPLQINGATSGSTTIQATDAVTATLTLPSSTGTLLSTANPQSGGVIQVVSGTTSTDVSSSTSTYVDTTLTATITPKFATSRILVLVNQNGVGRNGTSSSEDLKLKLVRNSTDIAGIYLYAMYTGTSLIFRGGTYGLSYLDSPATTSATTYKTQFAAAENSGTVRVQQDGGNSVSTITLLEIAQ